LGFPFDTRQRAGNVPVGGEMLRGISGEEIRDSGMIVRRQ